MIDCSQTMTNKEFKDTKAFISEVMPYLDPSSKGTSQNKACYRVVFQLRTPSFYQRSYPVRRLLQQKYESKKSIQFSTEDTKAFISEVTPYLDSSGNGTSRNKTFYRVPQKQNQISHLGQSQTTRTRPSSNYNSKKTHVADAKRGKSCTRDF